MKRNHLYVIYGLVLSCLILTSYSMLNRPKIAYVDLNILYNEFTMQKEMNSKIKNIKSIRQHILDSLKYNLEFKAKGLEGNKSKNNMDEFDRMRQDYYVKTKQFDEDNGALAQQYYQQILTQMNQYVQDYGKTYHYSIILGAKGDGGLMYSCLLYTSRCV